MKKELWLRLKAYHFENLVPKHLWEDVLSAFKGTDPSTMAFAGKLARKLGWTRTQSLRAIEEYKKFVYLGIVSDFVVTPPKVIDQVWHEHLLFTRGYREFCRDVIQRDFDHHPELLPTTQQTILYEAQYDATLALYRVEFHVAPPGDIWGTPKFTPAAKVAKRSTVKRSTGDDTSSTYASGEDAPLYLLFTSGAGSDAGSMPEFGGGGGFSGGGSSGDWGSGDSSGGHGGDSSGGGSGGGSDAGSDGGSDGGGSGCSSGCGGGGD